MPRSPQIGRPPERSRADVRQVRDTVTDIFEAIKTNGDAALRGYSERFDAWSPGRFR